MRLPEQIAGTEGKRFVREAVDLAASRGARVVGLGGLTAPATGGGLLLCDSAPRGVTLTNGNALTAFAVRENVIDASRVMGLGKRARVAVVGCTGSVGGAASRLIAAAGFPLCLVGRNEQRVRRTFPDVDATFAGDLRAAARADIVVLLTNDATALLEPHMVAPHTVVIDCAQPPNVPRGRYAEFAANHVIVVEGALVSIDGYAITGDLAVSEPAATFACLAETYLTARAGIRQHSVGRPSVTDALRMSDLAARLGVHVVSLESRLQPIQQIEAAS
jgi:predicted amino acid dehydrogenase